MELWIIEPRDPLIARDGRPFGPNPGARATSLPFPLPGTVAGALRTRAWSDPDGRFDPARRDRRQPISFQGPWLVELDLDDGAGQGTRVADWYAPAPADALLYDAAGETAKTGAASPPASGGNSRAPAEGRRLDRVPLQPGRLPDGVEMNLPDGLAPTTPVPYRPEKPAKGVPTFWRWKAFARWLAEPRADTIDAAELGVAGPGQDDRTHVSIRSTTGTAAEGALFSTRGLAFTGAGKRRLGLAVAVAPGLGGFAGGIAPLGGERRLMYWWRTANPLPECPAAVREAIVRSKACRLVLLTPGVFRAGWRPTWLINAQKFDVHPKLVAAAVPRPQVVSGWDIARGTPKPSRRVAPAGTVYFLTLGRASDDAARAWVDWLWLRCISDEPIDWLDGFGMVALGAWSGEQIPLEVT